MKAKVFDGTYGKVVKVKFELEFYVDDEDENAELTTEQVKQMIKRRDRTELGETVLNFLKSAEVVV